MTDIDKTKETWGRGESAVQSMLRNVRKIKKLVRDLDGRKALQEKEEASKAEEAYHKEMEADFKSKVIDEYGEVSAKAWEALKQGYTKKED